MSETIFDKILSGEIPSTKVYEDDDIYAFRDINPAAPVHVLVIPKLKITGFKDLKGLSESEIGKFIKGVSKVAGELGLDNDGYRIVFNQGKHGQQTVDYIHAHIIGGRQLTWPPG
ncbi:MAG: histidine triad nucleotide-binding protein [Ignavibacteriaceae bacterium]|jgi:Diadenosine tetraphosphate (Ap4A) hydrolase and other HIT family hydrolases|nr:MAG: histidine triad nucleotide-binding protein [Chlorobiota bacterium]KXK06261.1 MAG: Hit-like cell-cycle regulation protein [Chlorobi bacterium OLB4]MBV6399227.1 Purine nucleoside phosphoramidase [Ignavibacteria bacterium]MCC6884900.1 histidine triad nucleotide-binding protein [Ignavibacteriales bacterium]MCE7953569.1 histidine triad nucleotide-binding protein [Chlorobi bacterium CHB7]MDL1887541.1 histidine triad nucleotide-binding protein [Ignavibacteria bacterium CHB1]MEB2329331.1 hist